MRLMIASDIHGSAFYCRKMVDAFEKEKADRLLLLGDLLYHGPRNELPREYAPKEVIAMLNSLKENILCVRGNCDTEVDQMVLEFPVLADYCLLELDGCTVFATHGHIWNPQNLPMLKAGDILLNGHTHVPACERLDKTGAGRPVPGRKETFKQSASDTGCPEGYTMTDSQSPPAQSASDTGCPEGYTYMNPGSVSIPKDGSGHGYMVYQGGTFEWKVFDGE